MNRGVFSDRERLIAVASRLLSGARTEAAEWKDRPRGNIAARPRQPASGGAASASVDDLAADIRALAGAHRWQRVLTWSRRLTGAGWILVADGSGLLVAAEGEIALDEVSAIASRLAVTVEHAMRIGKERHDTTLTIEREEGRITVFPAHLSDEAVVFVALLLDAPLPAPHRTLVQRAVALVSEGPEPEAGPSADDVFGA